MTTSQTTLVRLQKIIADAGVSSRRKAEEFIRHGLVTVNGATVMTLGTKVDPLHDHIKVNGRHLKSKLPDMFVMLNKPVGFLSTFGAEIHVIIDRVPKSLFKFLYGCALKGDDVTGVYNLAVKQPGFAIKLDQSGITLVFQHRLTPLVRTSPLSETS